MLNRAKLRPPEVARSTRLANCAAAVVVVAVAAELERQQDDQRQQNHETQGQLGTPARRLPPHLGPDRQASADGPVADRAQPSAASFTGLHSPASCRPPGPGTRPPGGAAAPPGPRRRRPGPATPPPPARACRSCPRSGRTAPSGVTDRTPSPDSTRDAAGTSETSICTDGDSPTISSTGAGRDDPALVDHHHVRAGLLHLGQQVAGDQHRPAVGGVPLEHPAHLGDLRRVEPVGRLVQHQQLGQARAWPGRWPAAGACRGCSSWSSGGSSRPARRSPAPRRSARPPTAGRWPASTTAGCRTRSGAAGSPAPRPARPTRDRTGAPGTSRCPKTSASPAVGMVRPISTRSVVVLPAPFGPSRPTTWPRSTVKLISSTATNPSPYALRRFRTTSGVSAESSTAGLTIRADRRRRISSDHDQPEHDGGEQAGEHVPPDHLRVGDRRADHGGQRDAPARPRPCTWPAAPASGTPGRRWRPRSARGARPRSGGRSPGSVTVTGRASAMSAGQAGQPDRRDQPGAERRGAGRVHVVELDEQRGLAGRRRGAQPHGRRADHVDGRGDRRRTRRSRTGPGCHRRRRRAAC